MHFPIKSQKKSSRFTKVKRVKKIQEVLEKSFTFLTGHKGPASLEHIHAQDKSLLLWSPLKHGLDAWTRVVLTTSTNLLFSLQY